jgi:hypothetical protein
MNSKEIDNNSTPVPARRRFLAGAAGLAALSELLIPEVQPLRPTSQPQLGRAVTSDRHVPGRYVWHRPIVSGAFRFLHISNGDEETVSKPHREFQQNAPAQPAWRGRSGCLPALSRYSQGGERRRVRSLPVGGNGRLTSPQAGLAFELIGSDAATFTQPPPPSFASPAIAAEIAENYWMALTRTSALRTMTVTH